MSAVTRSAQEIRWWPGHGHAVDADTVAEVVIGLEEEHGVCAPEAVVDYARPEDSALHPMFEWDDAIAGEAHRVEQARRIIRSMRMTDHNVGKVAPAFVNVRTKVDSGIVRGYVRTERALQNESMRDYVLGQARQQLRTLRKRYEMLHELAEVWAAIDSDEV